MKRREESDGRTIPQGRRKVVPTAETPRGGIATTASDMADQLGLFPETAEIPKGSARAAKAGQAARARRTVPKSGTTTRTGLPAMTMEEVTSEANLREAFEEVARNKGAPGPDGQDIEYVREHLDRLVAKLRRDLIEGTYRPGEVRRVWIPKPGGGERGLGIPDVVDRLVQQAVHRVLSPHYESEFHPSSHGFRPGRSCHTAIAEAKGYIEEGYDWLVDLDLEKFFDRVHHQRLLARLGQRIADQRLLDLIRWMLKAKVVMPDGVVVNTEEGVPQGGPLSPLLSNIVLDELDRELAQRGHRFVRYADDCNIYVRSKRSGERVMASVVDFIARRLRLKVNASKSAVARPRDRHFLGFTLRRELEDGHVEVMLSKRTEERFGRRIVELTPRTMGQRLKRCIDVLNGYLRGWIGFFGLSCTDKARWQLQVLDARIRRRLRAIVLRQWRRRRSIVRKLIKLGSRPKTARQTVFGGRQGLWAISHARTVEYALGMTFFVEGGLEPLDSLYTKMHQVTAPAQLALKLG
jgi:RNA-directed DNA polymerase